MTGCDLRQPYMRTLTEATSAEGRTVSPTCLPLGRNENRIGEKTAISKLQNNVGRASDCSEPRSVAG